MGFMKTNSVTRPVTLWRYVLREHVSPFFFSMAVITLVFILNLVFKELGRFLSRGLGIEIILEFFFLNIAWMLALTVPMSVLVATLMTFGRLSGDNEIVAIKAGGISILQILFPVLVAGVCLSTGLIWFNNKVLPDFNHRARLLMSDIARKRPTLSLEEGVFCREIPDYTIMVQKIREKPDTSYVKNVRIEDVSDPNRMKTIYAEKGKIYFNQSSGNLIFILHNGKVHELDLQTMEQYRILSFPKQIVSVNIPNFRIERSQSRHRGDREKSAKTMLQEIKKNKVEINKQKQEIHKALYQFEQKYLPSPAISETKQKTPLFPRKVITHPGPSRQKIALAISDHLRLNQKIANSNGVIKSRKKENAQLMVEVQKKYSIPVSCIIFILIGAPLGIMSQKSNLTVAAGISFLFFLIYWTSLIGGEELADNQIISPFWAMWSANIIVGAMGVYLLIRSIKESTFINWTRIGSLFKRKTHENTG